MNAVLVLGQEDDLDRALREEGGGGAEQLAPAGSSYSGRGVISVLMPDWMRARAQSVQGK